MKKNEAATHQESDTDINQTNDNEIVWVSKSEIKRDAETLKQLGIELTKLSRNQLDKIPLDDDLLDSVILAQKIKKGAYRRQIQWIGKLLRHRDTGPIYDALHLLKSWNDQQNKLTHQLEQLRDRLIETGETDPILSIYPRADRQKLRHLARLAKNEQQSGTLSRVAKQIYRYLKELSHVE